MASLPSDNDKKTPTTTTDLDDSNPDISIGTIVTHEPARQSWKLPILFRSVLLQMVLFGALSFVGPAMSDAITNLGGGGLSKPWLANLANSLNYAMGCLTTLFGGPLINKLGIKWSCVIAACVFPLSGSSYFVSAKYGINAYLLASQVGYQIWQHKEVVGIHADLMDRSSGELDRDSYMLQRRRQCCRIPLRMTEDSIWEFGPR